MEQRITPMIHVPDVQATTAWYQTIGFTVLDTAEECGEVLWALLSFGAGRLMFSTGGQHSTQPRREVDLYVHTDDTDDVDELYVRLKERGTVQEEPHETFYGMREFILRDLNGFWITFGQASSES